MSADTGGSGLLAHMRSLAQIKIDKKSVKTNTISQTDKTNTFITLVTAQLFKKFLAFCSK